MKAELILLPLVVMLLLTFIMAVWTIASRVKAMKKLRIPAQTGQDTYQLQSMLPKEVSRIANNYNHLFEQPVVFYTLVLCVAALGHVDTFMLSCAWSYVALRIGHTLVQATRDIVMYRFALFSLSWLVLGVMLVVETSRILSGL